MTERRPVRCGSGCGGLFQLPLSNAVTSKIVFLSGFTSVNFALTAGVRGMGRRKGVAVEYQLTGACEFEPVCHQQRGAGVFQPTNPTILAMLKRLPTAAWAVADAASARCVSAPRVIYDIFL